MKETTAISKKVQEIYKELEEVKDPEIPVISVLELGIITGVNVEDDHASVKMTPTFTGCPAIEVMKNDIAAAIQRAGFKSYEVIIDKETSWNSNMITEKGKAILEDFGLGAPQTYEGELDMEMVEMAKCPYCKSSETTLNSMFGSALCRSIHYCYNCQQTFEKFKPV